MKIVLLLGPSSVGKSTLCSELKKKHGWEMISEDDVLFSGKETRTKTKLEELRSKKIIETLAPYMSEEAVLKFCSQGRLMLTLPSTKIDIQLTPKSPPIEAILREKNLGGEEIKKIADALIEATKVHEQFDFGIVYEVFDEAFKSNSNPNSSIILDVVPSSFEKALEVVEAFKKNAEKFQLENPNEKLDIYIVLAYCPPQDLSERIYKRNKEAYENNTPENLRIGLFPFMQLGALTTTLKPAEPNNTTTPTNSKEEEILEEQNSEILGNISRNDLLKIAYRHQVRDPEDRRFKNLAKAARNSVKLAKKFALWEREESSALVAHPDLQIDAKLNTTEGKPSPADLADRLLNTLHEIDVNRQAASSIKGP